MVSVQTKSFSLYSHLNSSKPITYLIAVRTVLMLRSIASVAEGLAAAGVLTGIRFLAGVRSQMGFQVLQTRVGFAASLELYGC